MDLPTLLPIKPMKWRTPETQNIVPHQHYNINCGLKMAHVINTSVVCHLPFFDVGTSMVNARSFPCWVSMPCPKVVGSPDALSAVLGLAQ